MELGGRLSNLAEGLNERALVELAGLEPATFWVRSREARM